MIFNIINLVCIKKHFNKWLCCLLCILITGILYTSPIYSKDINFRRLSTLQGLSQNDVNCIFEDSRGFIWIGTNDGLNRYDGYDFKIYQVDPGSNRSIPSNLVFTIDEDSEGMLWLGSTDAGVFKFDLRTNTFLSLKELCSQNVSALSKHVVCTHIASNGYIWVGTTKGGYVLMPNDDGTYRFLSFSDIKDETLERDFKVVNHIFEDEDGSILIGSSDFISFVNTSDYSDELKIMPAGGVHLANIFKIIKVDGNYLFCGLPGINVVHPGEVKGSFAWGKRLMNYSTRYAEIDAQGKLWCASYNKGLHRFDIKKQGNQIIGLTENIIASEIDSHEAMISCITTDTEGNVWMGINGKGVQCYVPHLNKFRHYRSKSNSQNIIRAIYEDSKQNLWIGTEGGGVRFLSSAQHKNYENGFLDVHLQENMLHSGHIYCFDESADKSQLFAGANFPLRFVKINHNNRGIKVTQVSYAANFLPVFDMHIDNKGIMWLASYANGLYIVYPDSAATTPRIVNLKLSNGDTSGISSDILRSVLEDKDGNIWIGSDKGLNIISAAEKHKNKPKITKYIHSSENVHSISNNYILPIIQTKNGDIWIGTMGGGLNYIRAGYDIEQLSFGRITTEEGLPNNVIKAIIEDDDNKLWLSTNKGLTKFDPITKIVSNYDITEGLQDYEFGELAACKRSDGEILFGGVNGFNAFYPDEIEADTIAPKMVITDFQVLNQSLDIGDRINGRVILENSLQSTSSIKLKYEENIFTIHFAALHYAAPHKNRYRYILEGFDKAWVPTNAYNRIAKYSYIKPGTYQFKVEGANLDGVWSKQAAGLTIIVIPPWWRTGIAFMFYSLAIFALIMLVIRYSRIYNKRRTELQMAHFEKEKVQELSQMKLQFYTNISHEFRTPLTLILGPIERLLNESLILTDQKRQEFYTIIQRNASILLRLINQLMDFRKLEQEKMELQAEPSDIITFIHDIYISFKDFSKQRSVSFELQTPPGPIQLWFDFDKLEKVLYNLLSNAFKFTQPKGEVTLSLVNKTDKVTIVIRDTGLGISKEAQKHIFERFYQSKLIRNRQIGSTGIGLALSKGFVELHKGTIHFKSEVNKGTTFYVDIPKGNKHLHTKDKLNKLALSREVNATTVAGPNQLIVGKSNDDTTEKRRKKDCKLLIVEDNDDLRNYLQDSLSARYTVFVAVDGQLGVEMCIKNQPDIVISDIMMPRMDGFDLCARIKSDEQTSHIPVILLTAKNTQESTLRGYRTGADGYVTKPFQLDVLEAQIESILQSRNNLRASYKTSTDIFPSEVAMSSADSHFLERLVKIIEDNMREDTFGVETMASTYGMTQNLMNKKLKALTGMSSKAFIRSIRMKRAAQLLKLGHYMVADVTYEVGMNDLKYFRQCFKAEFGMTPSEFIKKQKE